VRYKRKKGKKRKGRWINIEEKKNKNKYILLIGMNKSSHTDITY